ncbi:MAG: hypothetical protein ACP5KW_05390 [Thermoproteota archaeon]
MDIIIEEDIKVFKYFLIYSELPTIIIFETTQKGLYVRISLTYKQKLGDLERHRELAKEKRAATIEEYDKGRYTVVGDLAIKAVEQAIEALASLENMHFHIDLEVLMLTE